MSAPTITSVRAYVVEPGNDGEAGGSGPAGGADYHAQAGAHWIDDHIATPMGRYPQYRASRRSFGLDVLGSLVVVVEASDGSTGLGVTTAGEIGAWIVERHLARFVEGARVTDLERIWDQMYAATLFYGRRGVVLNAISGVDLALWDLLGRVRAEPVYAMLGGAVRDELACYATGPRPDLAAGMGFVGGKLPLHHGPAEGPDGLRANLDLLARMRDAVPDGFFLSYDCWMALDVDYTVRLGHAALDLGLKWIEEPLPPDDYWGYGEARRRLPAQLWLTGGEHEATRWGFRALLELGGVDMIQPDVGWCGGLTELLKIDALASTRGVPVVPHGSSVYSYHYAITRPGSPFTEFLMMHPDGTQVVPMFAPLLVGEPTPEAGRIGLSALGERPGFGVELNPQIALRRPYSR
ncbi:MAG: L-rhamnonate dehydratase [Mycobacteriales bacterium]